MPRLPLLDRDALPTDQVHVWDEIAVRYPPAAMLRLMANHPRILEAYWRLGTVLNDQIDLDPATMNLVVLRTCVLDRSVYGWSARVPKGGSVGLTDQKIFELADWQASDAFTPNERTLLAFVDAVASRDPVAEEVHAAISSIYPNSTVLGITMLVLYYMMNHRYVDVMEIEVDGSPVAWDRSPD